MNRGLLFEALLERINRVLEVALLILVLLLDVGVDLNIFDLLVLYIRVEVLINRPLKQIEIIYELYSAVYCIGEALDKDVVGSNLRAVLADQVLHVLLPSPEVVDNVTKISIYLIVVL
jgi:hypothetical protein